MSLSKKKLLDSLMLQVVMGLAPPRFLFQDKFTTSRLAGTINGTLAEPGPGNRTVTDTSGSNMSISGGELLTAAVAAGGDPRIVYANFPVQRVSGRTITAKYRPITFRRFSVGFHSGSTPIPPAVEAAWGDFSGQPTSILMNYEPSNAGAANEITIGENWDVFATLRAPTVGGAFFFGKKVGQPTHLFWVGTSGSSSILYPFSAARTNSLDDLEEIRIFYHPIPSPFAYDTFGRADGALGSTEGTGPDGQGAPQKAYRYTPTTLSFDGVGDAVNCGNDSSLDDLINGGSFTVEAWYRCSDITTGGGTERAIVAKTNNTTTGWQFSIVSSSFLGFTVRGLGVTSTKSSSMKDNGIWHHIAGFVDANAKTCRLAVDGIWQTISPVGGSYVSDISDNLIIGAANSGGAWGNIGNVSWVRISRGDRYGGAAGTTFTPPGLDQPPDLDANTIEQWNMNDGAGSTVVASVKPSTNNGAITGATWAGRSFAISGNAVINNTPNLGSDVVKDGDFSSGSAMSAGVGWSVAAGVATCSSGSGNDLSWTTPPLIAGTFYRARYTISGYVSGSAQVIAGTTLGTGRSGNATWNDIIFANGTGLAIRSTVGVGFVGNIDNFSMVPIPIADTLSVFECPHSDVMLDVNQDVATAGRRLGGIMVCLDNPTLPQNFIMAFANRESPGTVFLYKSVNGVITQVTSAGVTWAAGAKLRLVKRGTTVTVFYAGLLVITQAISDVSIISNKFHGLSIIDFDATCKLDNLTIWASGPGGYYSYLDRYAA